MKKKIICFSAIVIIIALLCGSILISGIIPNNYNSVKSSNFEIKSSMLGYLLLEKEREYIATTKASMGENYDSMIGLEITHNLRNENSPLGGKWFDYFYDLAIEDAKELLLKCEAANENNIKLDEKEIESINSELENINAGDYGISKKNLTELLKMQKLAEKFENYIFLNTSEENYAVYKKNNSKFYSCVDYKYVVLTAESEEEIEKTETEAQNLLQKIKIDGFDEAVNDYFLSIESTETIDDCIVEQAGYQKGNTFSEWAFEYERKAGDSNIIEGNNHYTIYYITKPPYTFDYDTVNGQIARKKRGVGEYSFTELSVKLNDVNSNEDFLNFADTCFFVIQKDGVLLNENLPENVSNWLFNENREESDTVLLEYGDFVFALRYRGTSGSYYETLVKQNYNNDLIDEELERLASKFNIKHTESFKFLIKDKIG